MQDVAIAFIKMTRSWSCDDAITNLFRVGESYRFKDQIKIIQFEIVIKSRAQDTIDRNNIEIKIKLRKIQYKSSTTTTTTKTEG